MVIDNVKMVVFHLPNHTLLFNESLAESIGKDYAWSILKSDVVGDTKYRAVNPILDPSSGKWIVGDNQNSNIGFMNKDTFAQYNNDVEWLLYTPFLNLETLSVDELDVETIPGINISGDAKVFISQTNDGRGYGNEWAQLYGESYGYNNRFAIRALGYCRNWIGYRLRSTSKSRMAFANINLKVS